VAEEVSQHQPAALRHRGLALQRVTVPAPTASLQTLARLLALDRGEVEALSIMEAHPQAVLLTDDSAARLAAEQRGYVTHGTIGILIRGARRRQRTPQQLLALLESLPLKSTLHIRASLLQEIIHELQAELLPGKSGR
jgi:predicted nucleic acid-binding protein